MLKKLLIIVLSILVYSCNLETSEKTLIGTWRSEYSKEIWHELTFREDRTFFISGSDSDGLYAFGGNYSNTDTEFILFFYDSTYSNFNYKLSDSNLTISYPDGDQVYTRQ